MDTAFGLAYPERLKLCTGPKPGVAAGPCHALDPPAFEADVRRGLDRMQIAGTPEFVPATNQKFAGQPLRRVLRIRDTRRRRFRFPARLA